MNPDQTATTGCTLFDQEASKTFQQMTKADDFCCDLCFKGYTHVKHPIIRKL